MSVVSLLAQLQAHDIKLYLDGDKLKINAPQAVRLDEWLAQIKALKPDIIAFLKQLENNDGASFTIPPISRGAPLPLSFAQQRLWFIDQLYHDASYAMAGAFSLSGALDVQALERALTQTVERQEQLRVRFVAENGLPTVRIDAPAPFVISVTASTEDSLEKQLQVFQQQPFDLAGGPLLRVALFRLSASTHVLALAMHHIVSDAWSLAIFSKEVAYFYRQETQTIHQASGPLPDLAVQYLDYAAWQRQQLDAEEYVSLLDYWVKQLDGCPVLELPTDFPRQLKDSHAAGKQHFIIKEMLTEKLRALCSAQQVTLFTALLTAYQVLLYRSSGLADFCIGIPADNRRHPQLESLVGFFVDSIALRTDLSDVPSFEVLLQRVNETRLDAERHQGLPFDQLVEHLGLVRDLNHQPLFQTMFSLEHRSNDLPLDLEGLECRYLPLDNKTAKFDLVLTLFEQEGQLAGEFEYNADLFHPQSIQRFAQHFQEILQAVVTAPQTAIDALNLLNRGEHQQLTQHWNTKPGALPEGGLLDWFEAQVENAPQHIAIEFENQRLSYLDLQQRANKLANYLHEGGFKPGEVLAVYCERGIELVVAILASIKAGGVYLPIDARTPEARIAMIIGDAQPHFVLTQQALLNFCKHEIFPAIICLDQDWHRINAYSRYCPNRPYDSEAPLYIIYTSGSTGQPKGVVVAEGGICNLVHWQQQQYFADGLPVRTGQVAGAAFDASSWDIWLSLCTGASLVFAPNNARISAREAVHWIAEAGITYAFLPTPLAEALFDEPLPDNWALCCLFVGGDRLSKRPPAERNFKVVNVYGPTECSIITTAGEVQSESLSGNLPSIGKPINNAETYVLDARMKPVPVGVVGELYIGGAGVALAYLNRSELSAEKFLANPYGQGRLYRSGDLVRWLVDGDLFYCGRIDQQVQIRGFRVELGEVECALNALPGVKAAVAAMKSAPGEPEQLCAYLVMGTSPADSQAIDISDVDAELKMTLPDYMVPTACKVIDAIPLTQNGKVDFKNLPLIELSSVNPLDIVAPGNEVEEHILQVWQAVLKRHDFGVTQNFFQVGGHSLSATQVMARLREKWQTELSLRLIFDFPTVASLAQAISAEEDKPQAALPQLVAVSRDELLPASFSQERLWVLDRLEAAGERFNSSRAYNISAVFNLKGELNLAALEFAFTQLLARHEILRTTFDSSGEVLNQCILSPYAWHFNLEDVSTDTQMAQQETVSLLQHQEMTRAFDLEGGDNARRTRLIRTRLLKRANTHHVLFITLHHIIADGWSVGIITRELSAYYAQFNERFPAEISLPPSLAIQFADYAVWQKRLLTDEYLAPHIHYWQQQLAGLEPIALPLNFPRPARQQFDGGSVSITLPPATFDKIIGYGNQQGVTPFVTLLSIFQLLLSRYSAEDDICVGTPIAQRPVEATERLIGFFVNSLAIRSTVHAQHNFSSLLHAVQATTLDAFAHQALPFEKLVSSLDLPRDLSRSPVFQTLFSCNLADLESSLDLGSVVVEQLPVQNVAAQFELSLNISQQKGQTFARFDYNRSLFNEQCINQMAEHFVLLMEILLECPDQNIHDFALLSTQQYQQQVVDWNQTDMDYGSCSSLHHLFEEQVMRTPTATALVFENQTMTYEVLNQKANQLAHGLIAQGLESNEVVAVCLPRSIELVVSLYAILKAGACYLPMDTAAPRLRLQNIIDETGLRFLITQADAALPALVVSNKLIYKDSEPLFLNQPAHNPVSSVAASKNQGESLAYVIFTSGSTGRPKGVAVPHRGVINRLQWMQASYPLTAADTVLQKTPCSFDVSVWEFFWPLFTGAKLVIAKPEGHKDSDYLCELISEQHISVLHFVPSMLATFLKNKCSESCTGLKRVFCSGEVLKPEHARHFFKTLSQVELINLYGPTEASIDVSAWQCRKEESLPVLPIGKAIANTQLYILDKQLKPVPVGVAGELYIGGVGLAQGYLGQPELSAEKFIKNPFSTEASRARLYKTGDKARFLLDGNIDYLGRFDFQIKLRGLRIELGEIENELNQQAGIRESVVIVSSSGGEDGNLVAYVISDENGIEADTECLKNALKQSLPDYMIPMAILPINEFPLSPNGKLDRGALPPWQAPSRKHMLEFVAPRNESETVIAEFWCELLKLDAVGVLDNFFELGGHSLLATQIVSRIREHFQVELALNDFFEQPTVEALALAVLDAEVQDIDDEMLAQLLDEF